MCHCHYRVPQEQSLLRTGDLPGDSIQAQPILIFLFDFFASNFSCRDQTDSANENWFDSNTHHYMYLVEKLYFSLWAIKLQVESAVTTPWSPCVLVPDGYLVQLSVHTDKLNRSIWIMGEGGKRSESLLVQQDKHASTSVSHWQALIFHDSQTPIHPAPS